MDVSPPHTHRCHPLVVHGGTKVLQQLCDRSYELKSGPQNFIVLFALQFATEVTNCWRGVSRAHSAESTTGSLAWAALPAPDVHLGRAPTPWKGPPRGTSAVSIGQFFFRPRG